jgi:hypothetical protein
MPVNKAVPIHEVTKATKEKKKKRKKRNLGAKA